MGARAMLAPNLLGVLPVTAPILPLQVPIIELRLNRLSYFSNCFSQSDFFYY